MKCPNCGTNVGPKKYLSVNPKGFLCPSCKARLMVDQSNTMLRYSAYLAVLLFFKYFFELSLMGILLLLVVAAFFDFMFAVKAKVVDGVDDKKE